MQPYHCSLLPCHRFIIARGWPFVRKFSQGRHAILDRVTLAWTNDFHARLLEKDLTMKTKVQHARGVCIRSFCMAAEGPVSSERVAATNTSFRTLAQPVMYEMEVKKSRFIAYAAAISTEAEALRFLEEVRDPSASHNCWAFKIKNVYRSSDDGEPGGTAGRPILSAIEASGLDSLVVMVVRFFGGTKLGTGGLVRAYGRTALTCLKSAPTIEVKAQAQVSLLVPFDLLGLLYSLVASHGAQKVREEYLNSGDGGVRMALEVDVEKLDTLLTAISNATRGRVTLV